MEHRRLQDYKKRRSDIVKTKRRVLHLVSERKRTLVVKTENFLLISETFSRLTPYS